MGSPPCDTKLDSHNIKPTYNRCKKMRCAHRKRRFAVAGSRFIQLKDLLHRPSKDAGNSHRQQKRWIVMAGLDGENGLARYPHTISQFLLGHFVIVKTQSPYLVSDFRIPAHGGPSDRE